MRCELYSLILLFSIEHLNSQQCYSCAGTCHSETCNCQMGSCQSGHCYIERKPTEEPGVYRITKGCLENPSRTVFGCDFDHFHDHLFCTCKGPFCNDYIFMRPVVRRNVTCRMCPDRDPDCGKTCYGQWCHEDSTTGAAGCGFGPPSLPFFYKGPELLYYKSKICVTMSRGSGVPRRHCICNTNYCNNHQHLHRLKSGGDNSLRSRSLQQQVSDPNLPLRQCVSCETQTSDAQSGQTSHCKTARCTGHFCTLARQQITYSNHRLSSEKQGCMNVSDSNQIQTGCSRKWMSGEVVEDHCACNHADLCNRDPVTASSTTQSIIIPLLIITLSLESFYS